MNYIFFLHVLLHCRWSVGMDEDGPVSDLLRFFALYDIILPCNYQRIIMNIFMMGYMKLKKI